MFDLRSCLACLNQDCKLERISDATKRIYCTVTGLDFPPGDCYPSYFCTECNTQIRKILAFRRRCRRAYFVLKEIVLVRKKLTPTDLSTVDRKKTNLKSSLDYWNNNNNGFYSVNKVEDIDDKPADIRQLLTEFDPTEPSDVKAYTSLDTTKYSPEVIQNAYIAIDIKPDNCETANDEESKQIDSTSDGDVGVNNDFVDNEPAAENVDDNISEIDLEDVFKGLPEEKSDDDSDYGLSELPEPQPVPEDNKKIKGDEKRSYVDEELKKSFKNIWARDTLRAEKLSRILLDFDVQLLPFEEQIDMFQARKEAEPYKSAGFKCSMCLIIFSGMTDLYAHVKYHNSKQHQLAQHSLRKYQCTICKDVFGSQLELTCHSASYHWYKYRCKLCNKYQYTLFDTLRCHTKPTESKSKYDDLEELFTVSDMTVTEPLAAMEKKCRFCGKNTVKPRCLEKHEASHSKPPKRGRGYQCDVCGLWCDRKIYLERHMYTHYRTFKCKLCCKVLQGWKEAHDHLKDHKKYYCIHCDKAFRSDKKRLKHEKNHRFGTQLDCNVCGLTARSISGMYHHQLVSHGHISVNDDSLGDPNYRCGVCGIQFMDDDSLKMHMVKRKHAEDGKIGGQCQSCKKIFLTVEDFVGHRRDNRICKKFPVKCVYCDVMLRNFPESKRHYVEVHPTLPNEHENAIRLTICEYCGKCYNYLHIKAHTKRHTTPGGEPSLRCQLCHHKMFTSRAFVSHMLFNHTPKPYLCDQCPYRGKYRSECREHILKVHAPELLYSCQKCSRRFSHLDLLQEHSVKSHGINVKEDRSVFLPAKDVLGKIFVFPHMKIDGSFIPPAVIEDAGLYLYDFLCKSHKPVDWRDYYVFDTGVNPTATDPALHRKKIQKSKYRTKNRLKRKPIDEVVLKAIESQTKLDAALKIRGKGGRKRKIESDVGQDSVKVAKLNENAERKIEEYGVDLQTNILREPLEADIYVLKKSLEKNRSKKKDREKLAKPVNNVIVEDIESESVDNNKVEVAEPGDTCHDDNVDVSADNVEHEEMVQGYDMPDLQAAILGKPAQEDAGVIAEEDKEEIEEETADEECLEIDVSQLLNDNCQVIEEDGEQFVMMDGNLYRLQFE